MVNLPNGEQEIVVVGGTTPTGNGLAMETSPSPPTVNDIVTDYVDVFSLETMTWREGPSFPTPIAETNAVPFKDTFIVAGGNKGEATGDIYK